MKNKLIPLTLALSTTPFAFHKMEGPFCYGFNLDCHPSQNEKPIGPVTQQLLDLHLHYNDNEYCNNHEEEFEKYYPKGDKYVFNYEPNTNYVLMFAYNPNDSLSLFEKVDILRGDNNYINKNNLNVDLFCFKKPLDKVSDGFYSANSVYEMCSNTYAGWSSDKANRSASWYNIPSTKTFTISLGVIINNNDNKIEITKENIKKEFVIELTDYLLNCDEDDKYTMISLLLESKILGICGVIEKEDDEESIIIGTAKDNTTNEKFFWITKIKDGLSTLLK